MGLDAQPPCRAYGQYMGDTATERSTAEFEALANRRSYLCHPLLVPGWFLGELSESSSMLWWMFLFRDTSADLAALRDPWLISADSRKKKTWRES